MKAITFRPILNSVRTLHGISPRSSAQKKLLSSITDISELEGISFPWLAAEAAETNYEDLSVDNFDARLLVWKTPPDEEGNYVVFHFFPGAFSIAETYFENISLKDHKSIVKHLLENTLELTESNKEKLFEKLKKYTKPSKGLLIESDFTHIGNANKYADWISRALIFSDSERHESSTRDLITPWLADTLYPNDAEKLLSSEIDSSVSWVNYAIVDTENNGYSETIKVIRIAQYYYAYQDYLNFVLEDTISSSRIATNTSHSERTLRSVQDDMAMLRVQRNLQINLMSRKCSQEFQNLMDVWNFESLSKTGEEITVASKLRLEEIRERQNARNNLITDIILVGIAFLSIMDFSMGLSEYSREVMSRPALEFEDDNSSRILSLVASVDTDYMIFGGILTIMTLLVIYAFWKVKR